MSFDQFERSRHDGSKFELYRFETEDNIHIWTYSTDNVPFDFALHRYEPTAIHRDEIRQQAGEGAGQRLTISVPYDNPVAALHVPFLPPRPILVTIYAVHRRDTSIEVKQCFVGYVTSFAQEGAIAKLQCSHIIDSQQQRVPWVVHKQGCVWALYEEGCNAPRAAFATPINSYTFDGVEVTSSDFAALPSGWFTNGKIFNAETGEMRFITQHVDDKIIMSYPFIGMAPGMAVVAYAGCDRQPDTCKDKFNNKHNYLGFDFFPNYNLFNGGIR